MAARVAQDLDALDFVAPDDASDLGGASAARVAVHASVALLALGAAASLARAQDAVAGSENYVQFARSVVASAGSSTSASYRLDGSLGACAELGAAPQWNVLPATVWTGDSLQPNGPLVFFTLPSEMDRHGGAAATLVGYGFAQQGGGPLSAQLVGQAAGAPTVVSNSLALVDVPPGMNVFGNPLGRGNVNVQNALGSTAAVGAFIYTPAVVVDGPVRIGAAAPLRIAVPPTSFYALAVGAAIPGFALPLPPLQGSLELIDPLLLVSGVKFSATGQALFSPHVADDPALVGIVFEFQALSLTSLAPLEGTFSNRLVVTIQS